MCGRAERTKQNSRCGQLPFCRQSRQEQSSFRAGVLLAFATTALLAWNVAKGIQNNWNLPQWRHHPIEEAVEVFIGTCIVTETMLTMRVMGVREFFTSLWCFFDFIVSLLTLISIVYGMKHLGRQGELCQADLPLLMLRFIAQVARTVAMIASTYRTRQMQHQIDEFPVDFGTLDATPQEHHIT
eukprot:TRINITY_DN33202_c0_g1_i4.p1 TRINITY_DN33202_c0_g1~~TRINITY_DN33202_c0_g1_i4.p1  ORF type:complete len:184 (+),score=8.78 TRINITY_DN33202_c0_g1_i4:366-917(+)